MYDSYTVTFMRRKPRPNHISIGMQGDNGVTTVQFNMTPVKDGMEAFVKLELLDGALRIPLTMSESGCVWDVRHGPLRSTGRFPAQLLVQDNLGEIVWQSEIFHVDVGKSVVMDGSEDDGEMSSGDLESLNGHVQAAKESADRSETAADRSEAAATRSEDAESRARELAGQLSEIQATPGPPGEPGVDGKSAYESAVTGGYASGEDQFYLDLAALDSLADALLSILMD